MPLLQSAFYQPQTDWRTLAVFGGIITAAIVGLVLYSRSSSAGRAGGRRFSRRAFRQEARAIGLTKAQSRLLETYIGLYKVRRPFNLLSNTRDLNITLGKALRDIRHMEGKEQEIEAKKLEVYRIKQRIDRVFADTNRMSSTKQLRLGQHITFQLENGNRFTSVITAGLKDFYCAQVPLNFGGEQVKWRKGSKVRFFIWGIDGEEMMFESKVLGYTSVKRMNSVMLQHSSRVSRTTQRKYRRRSIKGQCVFYPIHIVEKGVGRKKTRKAMIMTKQGRMGSMIDLSVGGCAMTSLNPLPRGELIKVQFEPQRGYPVTALGKIVDSRVITRSKTALHVMFTRASGKNLNLINEYIYDFD